MEDNISNVIDLSHIFYAWLMHGTRCHTFVIHGTLSTETELLCYWLLRLSMSMHKHRLHACILQTLSCHKSSSLLLNVDQKNASLFTKVKRRYGLQGLPSPPNSKHLASKVKCPSPCYSLPAKFDPWLSYRGWWPVRSFWAGELIFIQNPM